jgi:predicted nucleic acid-binding protein
VKTYFDPSVVVALYLPEPFSLKARALVEQYPHPLLLNELQELEFRNALRQKALRKEAKESDVVRTLRLFDDDCLAGKIERRPLVWPRVFAAAEELSQRHAMRQVCRAFDLLHVTIAKISSVGTFATFDDDQGQLARVAGLKLADFPEV